MAGNEDILKVNIEGIDQLSPALDILTKIDQKLQLISKNGMAIKNIGKYADDSKKKLLGLSGVLETINKKLKLTKLMGGVGDVFKGIFGAMGAGSMMSIAGLFTSAVLGAQGSVTSMMSGKRLGIAQPQFQALKYTGKQMGLSEDQLANVLTSLNEAIRDPEKAGAFATLGLSANKLKSLDPTEALFSVLDSVKTSNIPQFLKQSTLGQIGVDLNQFKDTLKDGSVQYRRYFNEYLGKWGGTADWKKLEQGDRAMIRFQTSLDMLAKKVGTALAPAMESATEALGPLLIKLGEILAKLIESIKIEDVERFGQAVEGFIKFFIKMFGGKEKKQWEKPETDEERLARRKGYVENVKKVFTMEKSARQNYGKETVNVVVTNNSEAKIAIQKSKQLASGIAGNSNP